MTKLQIEKMIKDVNLKLKKSFDATQDKL
jgi:hypothetical protein